MKLIKKVWEAEISTKLVAICVCLALIALLIPIARIMGDCVPWYDDFSYGKTAKIYWEMNHSFLDVLKGVIQSVKGIYYSWQGTYTSCFFMSMMPAVWGTDKYCIRTLVCAGSADHRRVQPGACITDKNTEQPR